MKKKRYGSYEPKLDYQWFAATLSAKLTSQRLIIAAGTLSPLNAHFEQKDCYRIPVAPNATKLEVRGIRRLFSRFLPHIQVPISKVELLKKTKFGGELTRELEKLVEMRFSKPKTRSVKDQTAHDEIVVESEPAISLCYEAVFNNVASDYWHFILENRYLSELPDATKKALHPTLDSPYVAFIQSWAAHVGGFRAWSRGSVLMDFSMEEAFWPSAEHMRKLLASKTG